MSGAGPALAGRLALVTGAASGIGRAVALRLARDGAPVLCTDRDGTGAHAVAAEIARAGGDAESAALDVTDERAWADVMQRLAGRELRLAALCAGVAAGGPIVDTTLAEWRRVMAVNLDGAFLGTRHAVAAMRRHGRPSSVVLVASLSGRHAQPGAAAYCASKAAVIHFARAVAMECRRNGDAIRVNSISPGGVKTPMWSTMPFFQDLVAQHGSEAGAFAALATGPHARFADPEEVAAAIAFLLSDAASFVAGSDLLLDHADGG